MPPLVLKTTRLLPRAANGRLADRGAHTRQALRLLGQAADHSLDPERYGAVNLVCHLDARCDATAMAALERDLDNAVLSYLREHAGRVSVPVALFYATAVVDRDGHTLFGDDIYG